MKPFRAALLALALALHGVWAHGQPSEQVEVTGAVRQSLRLDPGALAAFPASQIVSLDAPRRSAGGGGPPPPSVVRGVRLTALIERAGLAASGHRGWKTVVVLAVASDGYRALFGWPELSNTAVGDQAVVLFERDGRPLDEREGRIALFSAADRQSGPRHVRNLVRLEVRALD